MQSLSFMICLSLTQPLQARTVGDVLKTMKQTEVSSQQQKKSVALPSSDDFLGKERKKSQQKSTFNASRFSPPKSSQVYYAEDEKRRKLEEITDKGINQLYALVAKYKNSANRGELWLRLAELYMEKSAFIEVAENAKFDRELELYKQKKIPNRPVLNFNESNAYIKKSMALYEQFMRDFPSDPKMDQVLFFLGYANTRLGLQSKGAIFFAKLVERFPKSPYVQESQFALAEYQFDKGDFKNAFNNYRLAFQNKSSRTFALAKYKAAWSLFRSGRYSQALKLIESLLADGASESSAQKIGGLAEVSRSALSQQAMKDYIVFFAEGGAPQKAVSQFQKVYGKDAFSQLVKLGYYYSDRSYKEPARAVFQFLLSKAPTHPQAFDWKFQITSTYINNVEEVRFRQELYAWVSQFGPTSPWGIANQSDQDLLSEAEKKRESTLRNYVLTQHKSAQKNKNAITKQSAITGYRLYIQEFPSSDQLNAMKFYLADLLFEDGQYQEAAGLYAALSEDKGFALRADAELNLLYTLEKILPSDQELARRVQGTTDKVELSKDIQLYLAGVSKFISGGPFRDKRVEAEYKAARLYYFHNHFEESDPRFMKVIEAVPGTPIAESSANLLLDSLNLRKDYKQLPVVAAKIASIKGMSAGARSDAVQIAKTAEFKVAEDFAQSGKYLESANAYASLSKSFAQTDPAKSKALYNSGIQFSKASKPLDAMASFMAVLQVKSKDAESIRLQEASAIEIAKISESIGRYGVAAQYLEIASRFKTNPKERIDLLQSAGSLHLVMGDYDKASSAFREVEKANPKLSQSFRDQTFGKLSDLSTLVNDPGAAVYRADYIRGLGPDSERAALLQFENGEWSKIRNSAQVQKTPRLRAHAARLDVAKRIEDFKRVNLPSDLKKQAKVAQDKKSQIEAISKSIKGLIDLDVKEGIVAGLLLLGELNSVMFSQLQSVVPPKDFSEEEKKQFVEQLKRVAEPYLADAKSSFEKCVLKAVELELRNLDSDLCRERYRALGGRVALIRDSLFAKPTMVWAQESGGKR